MSVLAPTVEERLEQLEKAFYGHSHMNNDRDDPCAGDIIFKMAPGIFTADKSGLLPDFADFQKHLAAERERNTRLNAQVEVLLSKDGRNYCLKVEAERDAARAELARMTAERDNQQDQKIALRGKLDEAQTYRQAGHDAALAKLLRAVELLRYVAEYGEENERTVGTKWCNEVKELLREEGIQL